jgi:hypothetical protein
MRSFCILATLLFLVGCSKESVEQEAFSEPAVSRQYRQESATVIVSLSETNMTTAGKIRLMLDVHAQPGNEVTFPKVEQLIDSLTVTDSYSEPVQSLPNGKSLHRRVWTFAPLLPGESAIPAMDIQTGSLALQTEPITIQVASLLPQGLDTFEIRDIAEPVQLLPKEKRKRLLGFILAGTAGAIAVLAGSIWMTRRPKRTIVPTPCETARQALENLPEDDIAKIHALTQILLTFIEGRFHFQTAGKTIPEVLPDLQRELQDPKLEEILMAGEQIRFSNKMPTGFAHQFERYVLSFIEKQKEAPCD